MKCQILFSGKNKKKFSKCRLLKILPRVLSVKVDCICFIPGKLYKSKVCFIKHLWEHSVYWDKFDGAKNHERVLSIQAALILCGLPGSSGEDAKKMTDLLVTSPHNQNQENVLATPKKEVLGKKRPSPLKVPKTPKKRPRIVEVPKKRPKLADL